MSLLDDVYFYNREEEKWKRSFLISVIEDKHRRDKIFNRYLVAGYGPSLDYNRILSESDYIKLVDSGQISLHTKLAQK